MTDEGQNGNRTWVQMRRVVQQVSYEPVELIVGQSVVVNPTDDAKKIRRQLKEDLQMEIDGFVRKLNNE